MIKDIVITFLLCMSFFISGMMLEYEYGYFSSFREADYQRSAISESSVDEQTTEDTFSPRQEYWNSIPLPHQKLIVQIIGKDIKVKDVGLSGNIAYTGSMRPAIYGGNRVLEIPYNHTGQEQEGNCLGLKEGQIISFKDEDNEEGVQTMHRIIDNSLDNGHLRARGDAARISGPSDYVACRDIVSITVGVLYL